MKKLYEYILKNFPEVDIDADDINSPFLMMGEIVFWLQAKNTNCNDAGIIKKVVELRKWCLEQEEGENAEDDIWTIYTVAFYEKLFNDQKTHNLISHLSSRKEMIENRDYLVTWVGLENYEKVLNLMKK